MGKSAGLARTPPLAKARIRPVSGPFPLALALKRLVSAFAPPLPLPSRFSVASFARSTASDCRTDFSDLPLLAMSPSAPANTHPRSRAPRVAVRVSVSRPTRLRLASCPKLRLTAEREANSCRRAATPVRRSAVRSSFVGMLASGLVWKAAHQMRQRVCGQVFHLARGAIGSGCMFQLRQCGCPHCFR